MQIYQDDIKRSLNYYNFFLTNLTDLATKSPKELRLVAPTGFEPVFSA